MQTTWTFQPTRLLASGLALACAFAATLVPMPVAAEQSKVDRQQSRPGQAIHKKTDSAVKSTKKSKPADKPMTMAIFLDRLMLAESGGNDFARNRRSTATGSFQFIVSTFLSVAERHFPKETEKLSRAEILALRTDRKFARKAAEAYTKDNAAHLAAAGHKPTFTNLRLAFLLGPGGANRVLSAPPKAKIGLLLGRAVMRANPFMAGMTASDLIARAARDISTDPRSTAGIKAGKLAKGARRRLRIRVRCNLSRPSCKRWLALKRRRLARSAKRTKRASARSKN